MKLGQGVIHTMAKNTVSTYKMIELVGTSPKSYEDAIQVAVKDASRTIKGLDWFQVTEFRGSITNGKVAQYQAVMKVGFRVQR